MARPEITVRLAENVEGPIVGYLLLLNGFVFEDWEIDWSDIHPYWLAALVEDRIEGVIQVCPSKPVGWLEYLAVHPRHGKRMKARLTQDLIAMGRAFLKAQGSQGASGVIPEDMPSYRAVAEKRGWRSISTGDVMFARLV